MTIAIVLGGGGARGAFQVGALRYLYDQGIRPDVLCGTSAGAINAVKLAEGEEPTSPKQGLTGLETIWGSLQRSSDMYIDEAWLHDPRLDPRFRDILTGRSSAFTLNTPLPTQDNFWAWGLLADFAFLPVARALWMLTEGAATLEALHRFVEVFAQAQALFNLAPIYQKLKNNVDSGKISAWAATGRKLRLAIVGLESGKLRYVTEGGGVVERDGRTPVRDLVAVPPACQAAADEVSSNWKKVSELQRDAEAAVGERRADLLADLALAIVVLEESQSRLRKCREANSNLFVRVDVRQGAIASASIPGVFPRVHIGGENYVDGGVREILPLQAAVDLGAHTIYAIAAAALELERKAIPSHLVSTSARALGDILLNEVAVDGTTIRPGAAGSPQVFLISPDVDLYDTTTIDPGLIQIARDYGWMRAADVFADVDRLSRRWALPTVIASLRRDIWALENRRHGKDDPRRPADPLPSPNPNLEPVINHKKSQLQGLVEERRATQGLLPPDADAWSKRLERHPWLSQPFGTLDSISRVPGGVRVKGWAIDPDTSSPVDVQVKIDGALVKQVTANTSRADVGSAHPGYGDNHGYDVVVPAAAGTHQFCTYALNASQGTGSTELGCKSLPVRVEPFGFFDTAVGAPNGMRLTGWAIDPDTSSPIQVHVYIDGVFAVSAAANVSRPDVGSAHPAYGGNHGFHVLVPASPGKHRVCVYAINAGGGSSNPELGCKDVLVPLEMDSSFVNQSVEKFTEAGLPFSASITMRNTGLLTWKRAEGYRLGSQNPQDNKIWGLNRVELPVDSVAPGQTVSFQVDGTAPRLNGTYAFQWQLLKEGVRWFGAKTPTVSVSVHGVTDNGDTRL